MKIGIVLVHGSYLFYFVGMVTIGYQIEIGGGFDNLYKDLICIICMRWRVLILLGVFFVSFASATIPTDCESSMIAYWKMDGNVLDSYGSYDGGSGDATFTGSINVGSAATFLEAQKITIPADDITLASAFTIEFWMREDLFASGTLFEKGDYKIEFLSSQKIVASVGAVQVNATGINSFTPYHIALVWNNNILTLYVDGEEEDSASLTGAAKVDVNLVIGDGFTGLIDELAIYSSALSNISISSHYLSSSVGDDYCSIGSSTEAVFNIRGCNFDTDEDGIDDFGVAKDTCSSLPYEGQFYCSEYQEGFETDVPGLGCARGEIGFVAGDNYCCPPGYFCNGSDGLFQCDRRTENCFEQMTPEKCEREDLRCVWLEVEGICSDGLRDYDCGYYNDNESCINDIWNLGEFGVGTEMCGTFFECNDEIFSVPEDNCVCEWYENANIGQKCQNKFVAKSTFFVESSEQNVFEWTNAYELGNCTDGEQTVTWSSNLEATEGPISLLSGENFTAAYDACCDEIGCNGGEGTRFCGEPIIKLPGFSLFAFFASLFIIGMYYIKKEIAAGIPSEEGKI